MELYMYHMVSLHSFTALLANPNFNILWLKPAFKKTQNETADWIKGGTHSIYYGRWCTCFQMIELSDYWLNQALSIFPSSTSNPINTPKIDCRTCTNINRLIHVCWCTCRTFSIVAFGKKNGHIHKILIQTLEAFLAVFQCIWVNWLYQFVTFSSFFFF